MFVRAEVSEKGMSRESRVGDGFIANPLVTSVATDAALTLTMPQILGGVIQYTGLSAGRVFTTPTAADILAAMPDMDIGDTYYFQVSIITAFAGTWGAGTGVTLAGRATCIANTTQGIVIEKLSATTVKWTAL